MPRLRSGGHAPPALSQDGTPGLRSLASGLAQSGPGTKPAVPELCGIFLAMGHSLRSYALSGVSLRSG